MDWNSIVPVAVGALIALASVGVAEVGQWGRARRAESAALAARAEDRRAELWQISLPAAARVQNLFASVVGVSSLPSPYEQQDEQGLPFGEAFPEWWEARDADLERDVALIPSPDFRALLTTLREGIGYGWSLSHMVGFAADDRAAVLDIARTGFAAISAWMRGEQEVEPDLRARVEAVAIALRDVKEQYRVELEESKPKGLLP